MSGYQEQGSLPTVGLQQAAQARRLNPAARWGDAMASLNDVVAGRRASVDRAIMELPVALRQTRL